MGCVHWGAACDHLAVAQPSGKIEAEALRCRVQQLFNQKARNAVPTERRKGAQQTSLPAITGLSAQLTVVFTRSPSTSVVGLAAHGIGQSFCMPQHHQQQSALVHT